MYKIYMDPNAIYRKYTDYIGTFINSDIKSWTFKSNSTYRDILEHVSIKLGIEYHNLIMNRFTSLYNANIEYFIKLSHTNDLYGNTIKYDFKDFTYCSPTNLRYIFHSLLILTYMKECMLNNIDIIEIGGGYGGLCFFMYKLAHLFDITINTYSIFDLENPMLLQKKYLEHLDIHNVKFVSLDNIQHIKENSFLISNYAFSEISLDIQKKYTNDLLNPYVSHGFITWNGIELYNFINDKYITAEREYPLTGRHNYYVRFRPNDSANITNT